jgi:membrane-associated phospholipid phosphatase
MRQTMTLTLENPSKSPGNTPKALKPYCAALKAVYRFAPVTTSMTGFLRVFRQVSGNGLVLLQLVLAAPLLPGMDTPAPDGEKSEEFQPVAPLPVIERQCSAGGQFLRDVWGDQKAIWSAPFRMNRRQFFTIALPVGVATAGLIATDSRTARWPPNTADQIRWSSRASNFGAVYTLGFLTGGWLVGGRVINKPNISHAGRNAAEALANSIIVNFALKTITSRERPDQGNGNGRFWHGGQSFPSGHAMNSWAVALAVARTPSCPKWLAWTSYGVVTAVSFSRWGAHKHFPSDILVGSVLGGLIGNYVARRPR